MKKTIAQPQASPFSARMVAGVLLGVGVLAIVLSRPNEEPSAPANSITAAAPRSAAERVTGSSWFFEAWGRKPAPTPAAAPGPAARSDAPLLLPPDPDGGEAPRAIRPDGSLSYSHWGSSWRSPDRRKPPSSRGQTSPQRRMPAAAARPDDDGDAAFESDQAFEEWWNEEEEPGEEDDLAVEEDEADREFDAWWAADD